MSRGLSHLGTASVLALCAALAACGENTGSSPAGAPPAARYAQDGALIDGTKATSFPSVLIVCASGLRHSDAFPSSWTEPPPAAFTKFAERATVFESAATTAGWEGPSFVSLMTGMYPKSHGIVSRRGEEMGTLIPSHVMPAEVLRAQGWRTGAFTEGGALGRGRGLEQGFDEFRDDWKVEQGEVVEAWIGKTPKDKPFFLVVHVPLHGAKTPAETAARLLDRWTAKAAARSPLVTIFTADVGMPVAGAPAGARGDSLGEEWLHVPLAISAPGRIPAGRWAGSCSVADVAPTILDLVGLPRTREMDGTSLVAPAADRKNPGLPVRAHASLGGFDLFVVRTADAKFVARRDVAAQKWTEQVFDLRKDPKETAPLPGDRVSALGAAFAKAVEELRERLAAKNRSAEDIGGKGYTAGGGY
jgi:arylsulfatase A-like enzyme